MNSLKYILNSILILLSLPASPQASLDSLMIRVVNHNRTVSTASQYFETVQTGSRRNLYLENPEAGFAYLWGSPAEAGNRRDLGVSQSFAFPTVYTNLSKLSKAEVEKASQILAASAILPSKINQITGDNPVEISDSMY